MREGLAWMLAAAALAALALPVHALAEESLAASGSITYTWQGDPAHGCAAVGVCAVQGELIVEPQSGVSSGGTIDIPLFGSNQTVRVAGPSGDCVDSGGPLSGDLFVVGPHPGSRGRIEPALSSGRCAGPLEQDFARLTLPVTRLPGKHPSFDLRTTQGFTAGPFSGTMVSTLRLRGAPNGGGSSTSISGGPGRSLPLHRFLLEQVTLRYRLASLPGTLDATFSGESDPFCAALDSCGTDGSLVLSMGSFHMTLVVTAARVVRKRVGAHQALADLRHGRLLIESGEFRPFAPPTVSTAASEMFRTADGAQCQAASSSQQAQLSVGPVPGRRTRPTLDVSLSDAGDPSLERTYCPGPNDTDVFGQHAGLVSALVDPGQLLLGRSVVSLTRPGSFAGLGYVGTRSGALRFSLTLEHVQAQTTELRTTGPVSVP